MDWIVLISGSLGGDFIDLDNSQHIELHIDFLSLLVQFAVAVIGTLDDLPDFLLLWPSFSSVPHLFHWMWRCNYGANYGIQSFCVPTISCIYWTLRLSFQPPKMFKKWSLSHFCPWAVLEDLSGALVFGSTLGLD